MISFRFSLGMLMGVVFLCALICAGAYYYYQCMYRYEQAIATIQSWIVRHGGAFFQSTLPNGELPDEWFDVGIGPTAPIADRSLPITGLVLEHWKLTPQFTNVKLEEAQNLADAIRQLSELSILSFNFTIDDTTVRDKFAAIRTLTKLNAVQLPDPRWLDFINPQCPIAAIKFVDGTKITPREIELLAAFPQLREMAFVCIHDRDLTKLVESAPNLTSLELIGPNISASGLKALQSLPRLQHLKLVAVNLSRVDVAAICQISTLREVYLKYCRYGELENEPPLEIVRAPRLRIQSHTNDVQDPLLIERIVPWEKIEAARWDESTID